MTARHQHALLLLRQRDPGDGLSLSLASEVLGMSQERAETLLKSLEGKGLLRKTSVRPRRWSVA